MMPKTNHHQLHTQGGATLIELMVGITIGLLTIAVAIATLGTSRNVTTTVSDATSLQQQASHAFRVIGQQIRQAGSIRLDLASGKDDGMPIDISDPVAFETVFDTKNATVSGIDSPTATQFKFTVSSQNYTEPSFTSGAPVSLFRDCLGQGLAANPNAVTSRFSVRSGELVCAGETGAAQPIIENVNDFVVRYLVQTTTPAGVPMIQSATAAQVVAGADWSTVYGIEVCLDLMGDLPVDVPATATYNDCNGNAVAYGQRLHMVFRNVYQIRSQGIAGFAMPS
jgi:type IV pilus assembly protein PilW